jgi:hypothetical protein
MTLATGTRRSPRLAQAWILNECGGAWPCTHAKCVYWPSRNRPGAGQQPPLNNPPPAVFTSRAPHSHAAPHPRAAPHSHAAPRPPAAPHPRTPLRTRAQRAAPPPHAALHPRAAPHPNTEPIRCTTTHSVRRIRALTPPACECGASGWSSSVEEGTVEERSCI